MMIRSIYVAIPLLALLTILQTSLFPYLTVAGILPQVAIVTVLAWAQLRGTYEGLLWAFIAGFFLDLFSSGPMGATAVTLMVVVLLIGRLQKILPENQYLLPILLSGIGFALYFLLYVGIGRVSGYGLGWQALSVLPQSALFHGLLGLPIYWLLNSLDRALYPRQIES
jgi:rod shape-determining protein MreD